MPSGAEEKRSRIRQPEVLGVERGILEGWPSTSVVRASRLAGFADERLSMTRFFFARIKLRHPEVLGRRPSLEGCTAPALRQASFEGRCAAASG